MPPKRMKKAGRKRSGWSTALRRRAFKAPLHATARKRTRRSTALWAPPFPMYSMGPTSIPVPQPIRAPSMSSRASSYHSVRSSASRASTARAHERAELSERLNEFRDWFEGYRERGRVHVTESPVGTPPPSRSGRAAGRAARGSARSAPSRSDSARWWTHNPVFSRNSSASGAGESLRGTPSASHGSASSNHSWGGSWVDSPPPLSPLSSAERGPVEGIHEHADQRRVKRRRVGRARRPKRARRATSRP